MYQLQATYPAFTFDTFKIEAGQAEEYDPDGDHGYVVIQGHLVPYSFIKFLEKHTEGKVFKYGEVLSPEAILGNEAMKILSIEEHESLSYCLLFMMAMGLFDIRIS